MKFLLATKNKLQLQSLGRDERGLSTVEYVILLALIAVAGITVWENFGTTLMTKVQNADAEFNAME